MKQSSQYKIAIVGAGLSGTLLATRLSQRGYTTRVFEKRSDPRKKNFAGGRSINLALSDRGLSALKMVGLEEKIRQLTIPMHGRLIHPEGQEKSKLYKYSGRQNEWINSISRSDLNILLLDEADKSEYIDFYFDSNCANLDLDNNILSIQTLDGSITNYDADVIIATDGAGSAVRNSFLQNSNQIRFDFSIDYLDIGYKELALPPNNMGSWSIEKNALHIWPRQGFMMIALPNTDKTFTLTLFMPFVGNNSFETLTDNTKIKKFFEKNFPDLKMYHDYLISCFNDNPTSALATIRCFPWFVNRTLLLGDSAHAIVPFYGQGMNCAFEDCIILDNLIDTYQGDWDKILAAYQKSRKTDTDAIADLAEENFYEMRDSTVNEAFNLKRIMELQLEQKYTQYYSKYSLVTFREDIPYSLAMKRGRKQDKLLIKLAKKYKNIENVDWQEVYAKLDTLDYI